MLTEECIRWAFDPRYGLVDMDKDGPPAPKFVTGRLMVEQVSTLIVGGGLAGLALADALETAGHDYLLVEARDRFGGRIKTQHDGAGYFDLGPAWFWPAQPRIAALIDRLGLTKFDQYAQGELTFEDAQGRVGRGRGFSSMEGSWRLEGGLDQLTQGLAERLPSARKRLKSQIETIEQNGPGVIATLKDGTQINADRSFLALPPRVAAQIKFAPSLPAPEIQAMNAIPTWMAGQAKAIAVYDRPFWREAGLSGDANSRVGPMVEIHDASPAQGGRYALFGFIGIPPQGRSDEAVLRHHLKAQLERLFGPEAAHPKTLYVKDWAFDPLTAVQADLEPLYAHPTYGMPHALENLWDGTLQFAGTEVAPTFGGFLEGALEAAERAFKTI